MKNFFKKQREIIIIIVYFGLVAALAYFLILPFLARIAGVNDQIQEESLKQEIARQQLGELPKFQQQYDMLVKNEKLADVLLDRDDAVSLIERLEKMAEETNNKITISIAAQAPASKVSTSSAGKAKTELSLADSLPSTDYLQMKISLIGNYNTIHNFIYSLESFEYYSDVIGIQIGQNTDKDNPTADAGMFGSSAPSPADEGKIAPRNGMDSLAASMDVVFYTKK